MSRAGAIAGRAYSRASADFGQANIDRLLLYGGLALAGYLLYKSYRVGKAITGFTGTVGDAIGGGLYDFFHPGAADRITSNNYMTLFPDNMFHSVDSLTVNGIGQFTLPSIYGSQKFQMTKLRTPTKYTAANGVSHNTIYVAMPA